MESNPNYEHLDTLQFALSTSHNECSILATDLGQSVIEELHREFTVYKDLFELSKISLPDKHLNAQELIASSKIRNGILGISELYSVTDPDNIASDYFKTRILSFKDIATDVHSIDLVQPVRPIHQRVNWLRRIVKRPQEHMEFDGEPMIVARINNDTFLNIARVVTKNSGECSYLELGDEIGKGEIIATSLDDINRRKLIIEDLRILVNPDQEFTKEQYQTSHLKSFVDDLLAKKGETVAQAEEASLNRLALSVLDDAENVIDRELYILNGESSPVHKDTRALKINKLPLLLNDRKIELVLARAVDEGDIASLYVVVRNNLALPLVLFNSSSTQVNFLDSIPQINAGQRQTIIKKLHEILTSQELPFIKYPAPRGLRYKIEKLGDEDEIISIALSDYLNYDERQSGFPSISDIFSFDYFEYKDTKAKIAEKLKLFLSDPLSQDHPYSHSKPLGLVLYRVLENGKNHAQILDSWFNISNRLTDQLGESSPEEDQLSSLSVKLAKLGHDFEIMLPNFPYANKITADTILNTQVVQDDQTIHIRISGKPKRSNSDLEILLDLVFNLGGPIFNNSYSRVRAKELAQEYNFILKVILEQEESKIVNNNKQTARKYGKRDRLITGH